MCLGRYGKKRPMHNAPAPFRVLMISRDRQGLDPASHVSSRWKLLAKAGAAIEVCVASSSVSEWEDEGIRVRGTGGKTILHRLKNIATYTPTHTPDLITAQDPAELGYMAYRLARRLKVPFEVQDHGAWFDGSSSIDEPYWRIRVFLARYVIQKAQLLRSVHPTSAKWLETHVPGAVYWLPIVPSNEFHGYPHQPVAGRIVYVARLVSVKRHALLLEAFAKVCVIRADAVLVLVGNGPERERLKRQAERLGIHAKIEWLGSVPVAPVLASADVAVLLSSHEGWGVAAIEPALMGVPVVMSDTGCARWLAERGAATIATSSDPSDIANLIVNTLGTTRPPLEGVMRLEEAAAEQVCLWKRYTKHV